MKDGDKTKEQLMNELVELRKRIAELETSETKRKGTEEALRKLSHDLGETRQTLRRPPPALSGGFTCLIIKRDYAYVLFWHDSC